MMKLKKRLVAGAVAIIPAALTWIALRYLIERPHTLEETLTRGRWSPIVWLVVYVITFVIYFLMLRGNDEKNDLHGNHHGDAGPDGRSG
jgi:uncharacterized membrane protein